jgi:drug/metabolite transporter (DMT)-like permease
MDSPERIRFITKHYCSLQGLRFTPLWLFLVLRPWGDVLPNHRPTYIRDNLTIAMFLFSFVWIWLAGRFYRRRYGRVESKPQPWWVWLIGASALPLYFLCLFADDKNPPVSLAALFFAGWLGLTALADTGIPIRRPYYGIAAVCVAILALAPSTGWIKASQLLSAYHPSGAVFLGLIMTTLGLLDHFQLVHMFEHHPETAHV